jgi:hypothetical protein
MLVPDCKKRNWLSMTIGLLFGHARPGKRPEVANGAINRPIQRLSKRAPRSVNFAPSKEKGRPKPPFPFFA